MRAPRTRSSIAVAATAVIALSVLPVAAKPLTYACDPGHTEVRFTYVHAGFSSQNGEFERFDCVLVLDADDPGGATLEVTVATDSVSTGVPDLDADLRSENFFDAKKFPTMTFVSTTVRVRGASSATVIGELTVKDVTKPIALDVKLVNIGKHPMGEFIDFFKGEWVGVRATGTLERSDFKIDKYVPLISNTLNFSINAEMKGQ